MNFKLRETLLGGFFILCLVLLVGDRLILDPAVENWKKRSQAIANLKSDLFNGRGLLKQEDMWRQRWKEMKARALPEDESAAEGLLTKSMNGWAEKSRLSLTSLKPRWTRDRDDYKELEIKVSGQGSLSEVARFLYEVETASAPLALETINITARSDDRGLLTLSFSATAPLTLEVKKDRGNSRRARRR